MLLRVREQFDGWRHLRGSACVEVASAVATPPAVELKIPVEYYKLPNGLRVVLSQDHTAPTVCVAVYYRIGFRVEPRDRTGFAHLFRTHDVPGFAEPGEDGIH